MRIRRTLLFVLCASVPFAGYAAEQRPPELTAGLVGWWKLDDSAGAVAADSSGNGLHGRIAGSPKWAPQGGVSGGALEFTGAGDHIVIPEESRFDFTDRMTVTAWIRVTAFEKNWQAIVTKGDTSWRVARDRDRDCVQFAFNSVPREQLLKGALRVEDGQWHHVAGVYDGARMYLYVDGALDVSAPATTTIPQNDHPVVIGENAQAKGRFWKGLIDEVRVYDRALSASEIQQLSRPPAGFAQRIETENFRAIVGSATPAHKGPMHRHALNRVLVRLDAGTQRQVFEDGTSRENRFQSGDVQWDRAGAQHTSENTGTEPFRTAEIEIRNEGVAVRFPTSDPVRAASRYFRAEFENDQVRVVRLRLGPQETTPVHEHLLPHLIVPLTAEALWVAMPNGFGREFRAPKGSLAAGAPGRHWLANLSDAPFEAVVIEFKTKAQP